MSRGKRSVLTGTWSGYTSAQEHVVHRTVIFNPAAFDGFHGIRYTDGTMLTLCVRPCKPRERVLEVDGYGSLIAEAVHHRKPGQSVVAVADLS